MLDYYGYAVENGGKQGPINLAGTKDRMSGVSSRHQSASKKTPSVSEESGRPEPAVKDSTPTKSSCQDMALEKPVQNSNVACDSSPGTGGQTEVTKASDQQEEHVTLPPVDS